MMRQWRVGTFTLGVLLLVLGIGLLYSNISRIAVIDFLLLWWPLLFVLLGLEVLILQGLARKNEQVPKYDLLGIFVMLVILFFAIGMHSFIETGLAEQIKQEVSSRSFDITSDPLQKAITADINRIVVNSPCCRLSTYTSNEQSISAFFQATIIADNSETARLMLQEGFRINCKKVDDTLFVSLNTASQKALGYSLNLKEVTLVLPTDVNVELNVPDTEVKVTADMNNDWKINSPAEIEVNIPSGKEVQVNALVNSANCLRGSVDWDIITSTPIEAPENGNLNEYASPAANTLGRFQSGDPRHQIDIIGADTVRLYYID